MLGMGILKLMAASFLRVRVGFQQLRNSGATCFSSETFRRKVALISRPQQRFCFALRLFQQDQ